MSNHLMFFAECDNVLYNIKYVKQIKKKDQQVHLVIANTEVVSTGSSSWPLRRDDDTIRCKKFSILSSGDLSQFPRSN